MLNYDLTTRCLHYLGRVDSIDVPLGLGRQSVREAKIVSPTGR
eukprot:COSAG02_NODE_22_length_53020_cov_16.223125_11_plen_43_part_00